MRSRPSRTSAALALSAALLSALSACAGARPAPAAAPVAVAAAPAPRAFLWEITRPDAPGRPLYLTGSMHLGRDETFELPPSFEAALARAEVLVVELDPKRVSPAEMQKLVLEKGMYPPTQTLFARLDDETRVLLAAELDRVGFPQSAADRMRPWLVSMMLAFFDLKAAGFDEKAGLDARLLDRSRGKRDIVELETADEQFAALTGTPEAVDLHALAKSLHRGLRTVEHARAAAAAWHAGDTATFEAIAFEDLGDPVLAPAYEAMFWSRNRAMAEKLAPLAGAPRVHLAVVGAGHLVGDRGLLALLAARGLRVRQLARE
ncbi:TraB/GumN family protein [Anaeromyxobacter oryzae]|uniref:GumN protein n=1 Tax=Anaeromyxobacter oryzae TaxID=2918170 RepID=A0ABM7WYT3_9BACT|nr:TraB/GumN family protein [Anaeromyxobacter oryzae]BDG04654.1 GumN protein [Anaeromyxobacter oryzae]